FLNYKLLGANQRTSKLFPVLLFISYWTTLHFIYTSTLPIDNVQVRLEAGDIFLGYLSRPEFVNYAGLAGFSQLLVLLNTNYYYWRYRRCDLLYFSNYLRHGFTQYKVSTQKLIAKYMLEI